MGYQLPVEQMMFYFQNIAQCARDSDGIPTSLQFEAGRFQRAPRYSCKQT